MRKVLNRFFPGMESPWQIVGCLLLFAFPVTALVVPKAASTIFTLFALAGLCLLIKQESRSIERELRWVLLAFASYFLVGLVSYLLGEQTELGWKLLGRDIRFLAAIVVYFAIAQLVFPLRYFHVAIIAAAITTGAAAAIDVYIFDVAGGRASGGTISIVFGHLVAGLFAISTALLLHTKGMVKAAYAVGSIAALMAVILSGTRGALLAVTLVVIGLIIFFVRGSRVGLHSKLAIFSALVVIALLFATNDRLQDRVSRAVDESGEVIAGSIVDQIKSWPEPPSCFNDPVFLQWILDNAIVGGKAPLEISIRSADMVGVNLDGLGCPQSFVVELENPATRDASWFYLPDRNVPPDVPGGGALLMQGRAEVGLVGQPRETRLQVDNKSPEIIEPGDIVDRRTRQLIVMRPGFHVYFVPILKYQKEYGYEFAVLSTGSRFLMWRAALNAVVENPLFGKGVGAYPALLEQRAKEGQGPWEITKFDHAHNEILTVAADRGLLGLTALLGVYAAPFWLFLRRRDVFGYAGMAFVASIFLSGLTETIFNHSLGITYYSMMVLILATAPRAGAGGMTENTQTSRKS